MFEVQTTSSVQNARKLYKYIYFVSIQLNWSSTIMDFPCPSSTLSTFSSRSAMEYLNQKSSFLHQAILLPSLARGCTAVPGLKSYFTLLLHMCVFELNKFNPVKFILKSKASICQNWKQLQQFLPGEFYVSIPLLPQESLMQFRHTSFPYIL